MLQVAIVSGKGGTGKTSIIASLIGLMIGAAYSAANDGSSTFAGSPSGMSELIGISLR